MGSLSFLNPLLLIGLPAAGIPVLIHLINRRRARTMDFAAIEFVLRTQKRLASSWRLRQILLLLTRIGAAALLVLAFARPCLTSFAPRRGAVNLAVIVDNSYSMGYRHGGATCFDRAVAAAEDLLRSLGPNDNAALLVGEQCSGLSPDIQELTRKLKSLSCSYGTTDAARWIRKAVEALGGSQMANKHIAFLTDAARHGWEMDQLAELRDRLEQAECSISIVDVGPERPANAAVVGAHVSYQTELGQQSAEVVARLANFGPDDVRGRRCELIVNDKSAAVGFVDLPAGSRAEKRFSCAAPPGKPSKARIELAPDALPADDVRHLILQPPPEVKALLVDGSPGTHRLDAETFYLERALSPGEEAKFRVKPVVVTPAQMKAENLGAYDALFLCNTPMLPDSECPRVQQFLRHGGGVFLSLGDRVEAPRYNEDLRAVIPRELWDIKGLTGAEAHVGELDRTHPILSVFTDPDIEGLRSAVFKTIYLLQPSPDTSTRVLISLGNGLPLLVESRRGAGKLLLFTSSIDRDWCDLPIRPAFLPLVQEIVRYLSGASDVRPPADLRIGEPQELTSPGADTAIEVVNPLGAREELGPAKSVIYPNTWTPGIYEATPGQPFAVNLDTTRESDLAKASAAELGTLLGRSASVTRSEKADGRLAHAGIRTPLWGMLLAGVLLLILAESVLAKSA